MVKVKIIKNPNVDRKDADKYVGNIYEAFIDNRFEEGYCVNLLDDIWFIPKECCEEVNEDFKVVSQPENSSKPKHDKILLVEDGSVDVDYIAENFGIKCIVYRQGANKPEWLEINNE